MAAEPLKSWVRSPCRKARQLKIWAWSPGMQIRKKWMQIFVKSPTGRTICLRVQPSDTLQTVKAKIQEREYLVYDGVRLEDNLTLADYGVQHRSTLDLKEKMQIYVVETLAGTTITLEVDSSETIDNMKAKIQYSEGFPE
ncbi:polyubiquitin-like [Miscanthus floridulus]|uniref:polyubiquitin-like n=1 Tax=Miscanthus floridulus TaxID=154761 RepID=UPI00345A2642